MAKRVFVFALVTLAHGCFIKAPELQDAIPCMPATFGAYVPAPNLVRFSAIASPYRKSFCQNNPLLDDPSVFERGGLLWVW